MSLVQPPGSPVPLRKPLEANAPTGFGQVVAAGGMKSLISNGLFLNALRIATEPALSVQLACNGDGEVRLTSFCSRQPYAVLLSCRTWAVCAASALDWPSIVSPP